MSYLIDIIGLMGAGLIVVGVALLSIPASLITGGTMLLMYAILHGMRQAQSNKG